MTKSRTFIATPPGYTIKEQLEYKNMSQKEFAYRMDMSEKHISKLINGEVILTTDMAMRLELVLGVSASFWNNLEFIYREKLAKVELENSMDSDLELVSKFPYSKMAKFNWVPKTNSKMEKVINLRKYFEVIKLQLLFEGKLQNVYYRRLAVSENKDYALLAWAQKAKLESRNKEVSPINIKGIIDSIPFYRSLTKEEPEVFCKQLEDNLSSNGVSIVFLPHIGGSFLHGATFYDGKKIVLGLTVRGKYADIFWFSFFHEIAHIVLGHINMPYEDRMEKEADLYAENALIPYEIYNKIITNNDFSIKTINYFSNEIGVDSGIIVGRLQKDGYLKHNQMNEYKKKYSIE
jgi:HTH-type transcriptional regulator / antitoxin HigA